MDFQIGEKVQYKHCIGFVAFTEGYVSIAIPPSNVRIVVHPSDYSLIQRYGKNS